jgi:hypothetical protein
MAAASLAFAGVFQARDAHPWLFRTWMVDNSGASITVLPWSCAGRRPLTPATRPVSRAEDDRQLRAIGVEVVNGRADPGRKMVWTEHGWASATARPRCSTSTSQGRGLTASDQSTTSRHARTPYTTEPRPMPNGVSLRTQWYW